MSATACVCGGGGGSAAAVRQGRKQITKKDMYAGVDRFTQGETRPPLPTSHRLPLLAFTAKEVRSIRGHHPWPSSQPCLAACLVHDSSLLYITQ
jgi:hypothetical protein